MKKTYAVIIALALALISVIGVFAASFSDIPEGAYYADAAERMAKEGILSGYGNGKYYGDQPITRAQVAALVCKMLGKVGEAEALAGKTPFSDVNEAGWYTGYINYAVANDIIIGDGNGKFRPDDYVKYEEVVKVIVCVLGLDRDVKIDPTDWSKEYLEVAKGAGLLRNLIGKKGTPMQRSDIAVICDAAMAILDLEIDDSFWDGEDTTEKETTGKKPNTGVSRPSKPASTTEVTTESGETTTRENALPAIPF